MKALSFITIALFHVSILSTANADIYLDSYHGIDEAADAVVSSVFSTDVIPHSPDIIKACHEYSRKLHKNIDESNFHETYVTYVKLALIDPKKNAGWPYRHASLYNQQSAKKIDALTSGEFNKDPTPLHAFIAFYPALAVGDEVRAHKYLKVLKNSLNLREFIEKQEKRVHVLSGRGYMGIMIEQFKKGIKKTGRDRADASDVQKPRGRLKEKNSATFHERIRSGEGSSAEPALDIVSLWNHNGSTVGLVVNGTKRKFLYIAVRDGLAGIVRKGDVLFEGRSTGGRYEGKAYRFSSKLPPIAYAVSGPILKKGARVLLTGRAPIRGANGKISRWVDDELEFKFIRLSK